MSGRRGNSVRLRLLALGGASQPPLLLRLCSHAVRPTGQVLELEGAARRSGEESEGPGGLRPDVWAARCDEQTAAIVQLWDMCNVSLFHRTQFYLLFSSAAAADYVYLEVEQRRLEWLREQCLLTLEDGADEPRAIRGSLKRLRHER